MSSTHSTPLSHDTPSQETSPALSMSPLGNDLPAVINKNQPVSLPEPYVPLETMARVAHEMPVWMRGIVLDEDGCVTICTCTNQRLYVLSVVMTTLIQMVDRFSKSVQFSADYVNMLPSIEHDLDAIRTQFRQLHNLVLLSSRNEHYPSRPRSSNFQYTGPWDSAFWEAEGHKIFPNKFKLIGKGLDIARQGILSMALFYSGSDLTTNQSAAEKLQLLDLLNKRISVTREKISFLDFMNLEREPTQRAASCI